jgi:hypothetical protein
LTGNYDTTWYAIFSYQESKMIIKHRSVIATSEQ